MSVRHHGGRAPDPTTSLLHMSPMVGGGASISRLPIGHDLPADIPRTAGGDSGRSGDVGRGGRWWDGDNPDTRRTR